MAATIHHQMWSFGAWKSSEEESWQDDYNQFRPRLYESLSKDYCAVPLACSDKFGSNPGSKRFRDREAPQIGSTRRRMNGNSAQLRDAPVNQSDITAFVATVKSCAKKRDFNWGIKIYDEVQKRGLLEKCSDTLVIMYSKCGMLEQANALHNMHKTMNVVTWNALIAGYTYQGQGQNALDCFEQMQRESIAPDAVTYASILKACGMTGAADKGKQIHEKIVREGLLPNDIVLGNSLVGMYAKCDALSKAQELLVELPFRNIVSWNTLIAGYARRGQGEQALDCFACMQAEGISPDVLTYASALKACGAIGAADRGKLIHDEIVAQGLLQNNAMLSSALVGMYAKCGAFLKARTLLQELPFQNVFSWNSLIAGYAEDGQSEEAFHCFDCMQREGVLPNGVTYVCVLKACATIGAVDRGKQIHDQLVRGGLLQRDTVLGNALLDMYVKCGVLSEAQKTFELLPFRDVISWSTLIAGYAQEGQADQARCCFGCMQHEGIPPNMVTYICILKAYAVVGAINKGKEIHDQVARQGLLKNDIELGNAIVGMYTKCNHLLTAQHAFEELPARDVVSWNTLITGCAQEGQGEQALICFERMLCEGISPNIVTYIFILKICGAVSAIDKGKQIHDQIVRDGLLQSDIALGNALLDMYANCGALPKAQGVLDELPSRDVVSWSILIAGYAEEGQSEHALNCFQLMWQEGILPNAVTYISILKVCTATGAFEKGGEIHAQLVKDGLLQSDIVVANALVGMYAKCGALARAKSILEELPSRDIVTWSTMIAGYLQEGQDEQALSYYECMQHEGILPDQVAYICILKACGTIGASEKGKQIHEQLSSQKLLQNDGMLGSALVDMYAKCGSLSKAEDVLDQLPSRDAVSWNALIAGYAQKGEVEQLLGRFKCMQCEGVSPDIVTFVCIINVCSHLGLIEEGHIIFVDMSIDHGMKPDLECYNCVVDLFGRAGHLHSAAQVLWEMPFFDHPTLWHAMLGACQKWGDVNVGRWAFRQALLIARSDPSVYVLMGNIYMSAGMEEHAKDIQELWKKTG